MLTKARNFLAVVAFVLSTLATSFSLIMGTPLTLFSPAVRRAWMDMFKGTFGSLCVTLVAITNPTKVRIYSKHENIKFRLNRHGLLQSTLSPRTVVMANHQIYTDWGFIWWLAYTAGLETAPIMTLKKSLQKIPVLGWAMTQLRFLFLSRHWAEDEKFIEDTTDYFAKDKSWPLWLTVFPEGTVVNKNTQVKGRAYAEASQLPLSILPKNLLLPRVKGLQAILKGLKGSVPVLYDMTIVYMPHPPGKMEAETYYSFKRTFIEGLGPQTIKIHLREFPVSQIPYDKTDAEFSQWLYRRWQEKDTIYEQLLSGSLEHEFRVEAPVKPNSWLECCRSVQMIIVVTLALRYAWRLCLGQD